MKLITLNNGQQTQISDEDFIWASGFKWHLRSNNKRKGYVCTTIENKNFNLHRFIAKRMGLDCQNQIDHKDNNLLNNQRENLRVATNSQNAMNRGKQCNNTSGIKGVSWDKETEKWRAHICVNQRKINLGRYNTKEAATFAYKIAVEKYHSEFANTGE